MEATEKIIYSNNFGTVTDKRLILNYRSGTEHIPLEKISSISFQHERNYFFSIGSIVGIGILMIPLLINDSVSRSFTLISIIGTLFFTLSCIANWVGHHNIVISVAGQNRKPLKVEMAKTREGRQFVEAVNKSIFK